MFEFADRIHSSGPGPPELTVFHRIRILTRASMKWSLYSGMI